jgi:hypothetical protein
MKVALPGRRSITRDTGTGLEVVIPAKGHILLVLFLTAWLVGWAFGEVSVTRELLFGRPREASLFLAAWLAMWTVGGGWAIYTWLWMAVGKEIVSLRPGVLSIRRDVLGLGRTHEYDLAHVRHLRLAPQASDPFGWSGGMRFWGMGSGLIAFDYGAKTFRFGAAVDEAEASQIDEFKARHSFVEGAA